MWRDVFRRRGTCRNHVRLSMYDDPMETVEYVWVNIRCMLIAPPKILEREENIPPSSFYWELPDY